MRARVGGIVMVAVLLVSAAAGLAAPAAAGSGDGPTESLAAGSGAVAQAAEADAELRSGESTWQGQTLRFDASGVVEGDDRAIEVWRVAEDGQLSQEVATFTVPEGGTHALETAALEGRYVLRYGDRPVYVHEGRGYLSSPPDGSPVTVSSSAFRVARQTLDVEWSDPTAYPGQLVTLTVASNRPSSTVAVSAGGLSYENLTTVFPRSAYAADHDARSGEGVLLLALDGTTALDLNTTPLAPGDGPFVLDVVDTTARVNPGLDVLESPEDRRFRRFEHEEQVGDVVEAELACGHCFVVLGGPGTGFLDVVELRDVDGDGTVRLRMNTRYVGMDTSASGYPSGVPAYSSPADSVERYSPSDDLEALKEALNYDVTSLNDLREEQGLRPGGRLEPIEPGQYRVTVSGSDYVIRRSAHGEKPPFGADLVVKDETDVATVTLAPRSLDSAAALSLPGGSGYDVTVEALAAIEGDRDRVAVGDRLVFRFDAPGVFGYLFAHGATLDRVIDEDAEGIDLTLERVSETSAPELDVGRLASSLVADDGGDGLYLVVRTDRSGPQTVEPGRYRATLTLEGVDGSQEAYSTRGAHDGYPYLAPGGRESATATVTLAEATAAVDPPDSGDVAYLTADGVFEVGGSTSLAPGTTLTVVTAATEFAWETRATATVRPNGTWAVEADLAEAPGERFEVAVYAGQEPLDSRAFTVQPAPEEESTDGASSGDDGDGGEAGDGGGADGEPADDGMTVMGVSVPGVDGLLGLAVPLGGGVGALAVVWGAWRFVIRRLLL